MIVPVPDPSTTVTEVPSHNIDYVNVVSGDGQSEDAQQDEWKMAFLPGAVDVPHRGEQPSNRWVAQLSKSVDTIDQSIKRIANVNPTPRTSIAGDFDPKYYTPGPSYVYPSEVSPNNHTQLDPQLNAEGKLDTKFNVKNAASNALTVPTKLGVLEAGLDLGNYLYANRDRIDDAWSLAETIYDYGKAIVPSVIEFGKQVVDHIDAGDAVGLIRDAVDVTPVPTILNTMDNIVEVATGHNPDTSGMLHDALQGESAVEVFTNPINTIRDDGEITIGYFDKNDKGDNFFEAAQSVVTDIGTAIGEGVGTVIDKGAEFIGGAIDAVGGWVDSWKWW